MFGVVFGVLYVIKGEEEMICSIANEFSLSFLAILFIICFSVFMVTDGLTTL